MCQRQLEARLGQLHGDLVIARIDLDQQRSLLHPVVVFRVNADNGAVDAGADRIYVAIDFGIIGGFVRLQIVPRGRRRRAKCGNQ